MRLEKRGIWGAVLAAAMLPGLASAGSIKELADWSALPAALNGHDVKFVMTDGSSLKRRLLRHDNSGFVVKTQHGELTFPYQQIAEVHATIRDSSVRAYCAVALAGPVGILMSADGSPTCWQSAVLSLIVPVVLPWTAVGLATMPVMLPVKYFKSRHTYHFKLQP